MSEPPARDALRAETAFIAGSGGDQIEAYLAQPLHAGPHGGVVVIHHMPGYDGATKEITRRFAANGYLAICPNLYEAYGHGKNSKGEERKFLILAVRDKKDHKKGAVLFLHGSPKGWEEHHRGIREAVKTLRSW